MKPTILTAWFVSGLASLAIVLFFGVDVPRGDDWNTPGDLLLAAKQGTVSFQSFFQQHNESRIVFAKLLFWPVAHLTGWNSRVFHLINWAVLFVIGGLIVRLLLRAVGQQENASRGFMALSMLTVALAMSPLHWNNLLWTIQLIVFIVPLCFFLAVGHNQSPRSLWTRGAVAAGLSTVATFSYANGMVVWPFLWPGWRSIVEDPSRPTIRRAVVNPVTGVYCVMALLVVGAYIADFKSPQAHPGTFSGLSNPVQMLGFIVVWLVLPLASPGVLTAVSMAPPLSRIIVYSILAVAGITAGLMAALFWRRRRTLLDPSIRSRAYPWLMLIAYGLLTCFISASGRSAWGIFAAATDRYVTFSVFLHVGFLGLLVAMASGDGVGRMDRRLMVAFASLYFVLLLVSSATSFWMAARDQRWSLHNRLSLETSRGLPENPMLTRFFGRDPKQVTQRYLETRRWGYLPGFRDIGDLVNVPLADKVVQGQIVESHPWPWCLRVNGVFQTPEEGSVEFVIVSSGDSTSPTPDSLALLSEPAPCPESLGGVACHAFESEFIEPIWPSPSRRIWAVMSNPPRLVPVQMAE